jgi:hypothetical protein
MADPEHHDEIHLPSPSGAPIVTGAGVALILFGFVPDARLWRLALVSLGVIIATGAVWHWLQDAIAEYRDLRD